MDNPCDVGGDAHLDVDRLSVDRWFWRRAQRHRPIHRFAGTSAGDWQTWRDALLPALSATLGERPQTVPLNPRITAEWENDGVRKQRVLIDVEEELCATLLIYRPANLAAGEKRPLILCCHGHGPFGKDSVMGLRGNPQQAATIEQFNYDYGLQLAKAGFVTLSLDWRGFGERDDRRKPHFHDLTLNRDPCNLMYLRATLLGITVMALNLHDAGRALDYACDQPFVNRERIGVIGLSLGGTMATWVSLFDPRIKAADVVCYSERFANFGFYEVNLCGSQVTPGLFKLCDVPDLHGLIAPRPLLVEIGTADECFEVDPALSCFREVKRIYAAAGAERQLELELFEGGHRWGGSRSAAFFRTHLGGTE